MLVIVQLGGSALPCAGQFAGIASSLFYHINSKVQFDKINGEYNSGTYNVKFKESSVQIEKISIKLISGTKNADMINDYTYSIWKPNDDLKSGILDTVISPNEIAAYGKVELINGKIKITGTLFKESDFKVYTEGDKTIVEFTGNISFDVPNNINIESLAVTSSGDILPNETKIITSILEKDFNNTGLSLNLFPNPTSDYLEFTLNKKDVNVTSVKIFDIKGQTIDSDFKIQNSTNKLNINELSNGTYYLLFELQDGNKILKQFIKQ